MATHTSILAWKIPWTKKPDGLQSVGLQRVGHNSACTHTHTHTHTHEHTHTKSIYIPGPTKQRTQRPSTFRKSEPKSACTCEKPNIQQPVSYNPALASPPYPTKYDLLAL